MPGFTSRSGVLVNASPSQTALRLEIVLSRHCFYQSLVKLLVRYLLYRTPTFKGVVIGHRHHLSLRFFFGHRPKFFQMTEKS